MKLRLRGNFHGNFSSFVEITHQCSDLCPSIAIAPRFNNLTLSLTVVTFIIDRMVSRVFPEFLTSESCAFGNLLFF